MTKAEYIKFLESKFAQLNEKGDYNIFCHMISDSKRNLNNKVLTQKEVFDLKINYILKNGLSMKNEAKYSSYYYGSINGKIKFMGSADTAKAEDFANYFFYGDDKNMAVAIFAIPKYIKKDEREFEFSSNKGHTELKSEQLQYLKELYKKRLYIAQDNQCKTTLLDLVTDGSSLPAYYVLGFQTKETIVNEENQEVQVFDFKENEDHISTDYFKEEEHAEFVVGKLKKVFAGYNTESVDEILISETVRAASYNDDYLNEP